MWALQSKDKKTSHILALIILYYRYVSPELLEGDMCTGAADLWALGCILYRMFVGYTPFSDPNESNEFKIFARVKGGQY